MKVTLIINAATAFIIMPPPSPPPFGSPFRPPSFAEEFWKDQSKLQKMPMFPVEKPLWGINRKVEANFWHVKSPDSVVGVRMMMNTKYPTYNLNNNAYVFCKN